MFLFSMFYRYFSNLQLCFDNDLARFDKNYKRFVNKYPCFDSLQSVSVIRQTDHKINISKHVGIPL